MVHSARSRALLVAIAAFAVAIAFLPVTPADSLPPDDFTLTILHHNDGESQLVAAPGQPDYGGVARFKALADRLKAASNVAGNETNTDYVMLTSGDNILAGPEFTASSSTGFAPFYDAVALREIGYDAMVIGNHDLDFGPDVLQRLVEDVNTPPTIPFLSANLDVTAEPGLAALAALSPPQIASSTVITRDGRDIGIIGATTENLPFISSPRDVIVNAVKDAVEAEVATLTAAGVNIIILSAHLQGIDEDIALIGQLDGIDVAIAGGGDELLSNGEPLVPGDDPDGRPYPVIAQDIDGTDVPIVTGAGDYKYIGRLVATFNDAGDLLSIDPSSGPVRVADASVAADGVVPDPVVKAAVTDPVAAFVAGLDANVVAQSEVALDGRRSPGIRTMETNLGNLIADSFLWQANELAGGTVDVALGNGGGIRNNSLIPAGDVTELDTFDILPFSNFLSVFDTVSRDRFKLVMENAVSRVDGTSGTGRFAQIAGFTVIYDPLGSPAVIESDGTVTDAGSRILHIELDDGTVLVEDRAVVPGAPISLTIVDFLARGGDQYPLGDLPFTNLGVSYQQALFNYVTTGTGDGGLGGDILATDYPEGGEGRIVEALRINEFVFNHTGSDTDEFIEIAGLPDTDYAAYSLLVVEGDTTGAGVIDDVFTVGATSADGLWFTGFASNALENGTQTAVLVKGFSGSQGDDLDTDNDGVLDMTPWDALVDDVAVFDGGSSDHTYSTTVLEAFFDGNPFAPGGASRIPNAVDTDSVSDWTRNDFGGDGLPSFPGAAAPLGIARNTPGAVNTVQDADIVLLTIPEIQGAGHLSPHAGSIARTEGVVTAVAFNGFYLQDPAGDGDDATSDGIFVDPDSGPPVAVGDEVRVTGPVNEDIPGGAGTGNLSTTELSGEVEILSNGNPLPAPVVIGTGGRVVPAVDVISRSERPVNLQTDPGTFNPDNDGIDFYESLEGMLVTVEDPVAVSATRTFSRFSSEVFTLTNDGDETAPEDARTDRGGIALQPHPDNDGDQNPERVQIQFDGTLYPASVPALTVGDRLEDVTGVVGYSFGNFEVNAIEAVVVAEESDLEEETTDLTGTHRDVTVASYNVLNLSPDSSDDAQRATVARHIVDNLGAPDVVALQEIQDNSGQIDDGVTEADQTLQALVDAIAAAGGPDYEFFDVAPADGSSGGIPGGNIRNAYLYNPDRVRLVSYTSLTPDVLADLRVSEPNAFDGTRDPLMATFSFRGRTFTVINNHLTSRFGSTPVFGGPQPFVQAGEAEREAQVGALNEVTDRLTSYRTFWYRWKYDTSFRGRIIVLGDLNTFEFTNDLKEILPGTGRSRVLTNLVSKVDDDDAYTFIFEGNSQALDHVFVTRNLKRNAELDIVHVNVDFPRVDSTVGSDHEPLVASLELRPRWSWWRWRGGDLDFD